MPSSESVLVDPLLLESNDFTPSTRSSTSESISDSSPLPTRKAQSDIAADIKVISAGQDKKVMILQLAVSATTSGFNKINLGEEDFSPSHNNCLYFGRWERKRNHSHHNLNSDLFLHSPCGDLWTQCCMSYHYHEPLQLILLFISGSTFKNIHKSLYKHKLPKHTIRDAMSAVCLGCSCLWRISTYCHTQFKA